MGDGDKPLPDITGGDVVNSDLSVGENVGNGDKLPTGVIALDCTIVGRSNVGGDIENSNLSVGRWRCGEWR